MQKIMVIEDDTAIQEELALLLENEGYTPLVVTNFTDILGQAVLERPDLILLDIGLQGGMVFPYVPLYGKLFPRRLFLSPAEMLVWTRYGR